MANLYEKPATSALNEDAYVNKIYDSTMDSQKKVLQQGYDSSVKQLQQSQQATAQQTQDYTKRADVEGAKATGNVQTAAGGNVGAQAKLALGNQRQANVSTLNSQQAAADQEYERVRRLRGEQYAAQIKKAQADNDMERAQALYEAAKAEEEQLRSLRQTAASMMAAKGDNSILESIANGNPVQRDTQTETDAAVLKNEDSINKIYDAQLEAQRQDANLKYMEGMSELEKAQAEARRATDQNLTKTYVDALRKNQNAQEVQNAYGQSSGTVQQRKIARETALMKALTDLRKVQLGKDATTGIKQEELVRSIADAYAKGKGETDSKRNQALYKAAEGEEQALVQEQQFAGELLAKQNNYSLLGKLYGLTPDQVDRLQGTGAYAPSYGGDGEKTGYYQKWSNKALQNMANQGIANYEANRTPLSSSAKQELAKPTVVRGSSSSQKYVK